MSPPVAPADEKLSHVPCDIALVIDVSGSMNAEAPMPRDPDEPDDKPNSPHEKTGLSVLDLVKHSCRTILSSMDERDRLAIIKFSNRATVLQDLTFTTDANKKAVLENIEKMRPEGSTNLWHALKDGIKVFQDAEHVGNVPAIMVLTDGKPNHMCPAEGYIPALRQMGTIVPSIHTFGFGYSLRSGLLKSIAEFGGGNYAFIPDAGMIGTTFVHAVAHLQSTFAMDANLHLTCTDHVTLEETMGSYVKQQGHPDRLVGGRLQYTIPLGNIQYGQSRDIYLRWKSNLENHNELAPPYLNATLEYRLSTATRLEHKAGCRLLDLSGSLTKEEIAYHTSRSQLCTFLAGLCPIDERGEHHIDCGMVKHYGLTEAPGLKPKQQALVQLINSLPAAQYPNDARCRSLMQDLNGGPPFGQISIALSSQKNFDRWGQHYLTSLHGAHARQLCNNFKDPGPLQYGTASPLFRKCRDALNEAFNDLPPPTPSLGSPWPGPGRPRQPDTYGCSASDPLYRMRGRPYPELSMASYNMPTDPCFAGQTMVELASGKRIRMRNLRKEMSVLTPMGARRVAAVLATPVKGKWLVDIEGVLVTPWHPVSLPTTDAGHGWQFPRLMVKPEDTATQMIQYTGCIYSVLLQPDDNVDAHAILLGASSKRSAWDATPFWGVTLGHGMVVGADVRAHEFFGNYTLVLRSLLGLRVRNDGCLLTGGVVRSETTGLVCGFKQHRAPQAKRSSSSHRLTGPVYQKKVAFHIAKRRGEKQGPVC